MQKSQKAVTEFMRLFGQAIPEKPTIPGDTTRAMRVHSLAEEVGELAQASGVHLTLTASPHLARPKVEVTVDPDAVPQINDIADALVDLQYFVDGSACAYGLDLEPFFDAVHCANMSKLWSPGELQSMEPGWTAHALAVMYVDGHYELPPVKQDGRAHVTTTTRFIVKRPDGKVMKPPTFKPADLSEIMEQQKCRHDDKVAEKVHPNDVGMGRP